MKDNDDVVRDRNLKGLPPHRVPGSLKLLNSHKYDHLDESLIGIFQNRILCQIHSGVNGNDIREFGNGNRNGMKKNIPEIREWEGNEKIYSQNSGKGRE